MPQVTLDEMVLALDNAPALVSFPTDTVPALAARPEHAGLIYAAKRRPPEKPLILMAAQLADLRPYVLGTTADWSRWEQMSKTYWPGQLTLILPASEQVPLEMTPGMDPSASRTVGVRVPAQRLAIDLLTRVGPLATTSANLSGQAPLTTVEAIAQTFPTALTLAQRDYDLGPTSGQPSTVAKWTAAGWQILRQGAVSLPDAVIAP